MASRISFLERSRQASGVRRQASYGIAAIIAYLLRHYAQLLMRVSAHLYADAHDFHLTCPDPQVSHWLT